MKTTFSKSLTIFAFILITFTYITGLSAQGRWRPMGPDESNRAALDGVVSSDMVVTHDGIPYVVYLDQIQGSSNRARVTVRKFINGVWQNVGEPVLSLIDQCWITLDPLGVPYIGGVNTVRGGVSVFRYNGNSWDAVGDSTIYKGGYTDSQVAFDTLGNLYMAFVDTSHDVAIMKYNGNTWNYIGARQSEPSVPINVRIAVNLSGVPYVVYNKDTIDALPIVKRYDGISWVQVGSLGNGGGTYRGASIRINSAGTPYIYYTGPSPGFGLHVLSFDGSSWVNVGGQSPSVNGYSLFKNTMDLDKYGYPYITFQAPGVTSVMRYDGQNWISLSNIPNLTGSDYPAYLGLDSMDDPNILVTDFSQVKVVRYNNNSWSDLGEKPSIPGLGQIISNNSEFSYVVTAKNGSNSSQIIVNRYNGNSWTSIGTFTRSNLVQYYSPPTCSLDSIGNPFVEYADSAKNYVKYYNGSNWIDIGPPIFLPTFYVDLKVNKTGKPYLAYIDLTDNRKLKILAYDGVAWTSIDTNGFNFKHVYDHSFYFDKQNNLFVSYLDSPGYTYHVLKYENAAWSSLGGPVDRGTKSQLILDSQDTPFLLYHSQTYNYQPVLLKYSGNTWVPVGNAPFAYHAVASRFVLDNAGRPFVIFSDTSSLSNYATNTVRTFDGNSWVDVGSPNFSKGKNYNPSIAITPTGVLYALSYSIGLWGYKYNVRADSVVWPGDADANNVVDNRDLLPIGLAYGAMGAARVTQSIVWSAWPSIDWADTFTNYIAHVNFKNADCNGNGIINADDTLAIMQNFTLTHSKTGDRGNPWRSGIPSLMPVLSRDTLRISDTFSVSFVLGSSGSPVNNLYGLAFTYNFDPMLVDPSFTTSSVANSWIDSGSDKLSIARVVNSDGKIKIGLTRINHTSCNGYGPIASSQFKMVDQSRDNYNNFCNIGYISDLVAIDESGVLIPLNTGADTSHVFIINTEINNIDNESIHIWPNPTNSKVQISSPIQITEIGITNSIGQNVLILSELSAKAINIDLSNVPSGIYLAYIKTVNGTGIKKLVLEK